MRRAEQRARLLPGGPGRGHKPVDLDIDQVIGLTTAHGGKELRRSENPVVRGTDRMATLVIGQLEAADFPVKGMDDPRGKVHSTQGPCKRP